jgi:hypothetical protein
MDPILTFYSLSVLSTLIFTAFYLALIITTAAAAAATLTTTRVIIL